jgi:hypothetical protein
LNCKSCGTALDYSMATCPGCGAEAELGRLTGILGVVCRGCDAYNEPGAKVCAGCGQPLGKAAPPAPAEPAPPPAAVAAVAAAPLPQPRPAAGPPTRVTPALPARPAAAPPPPPASAPLPAGLGPGAPPPPSPVPAALAAGAPPPDAPLLRSFPKPAGAGGPATRFIPSLLAPRARADAPALTPIPLQMRCPRCGAEAGAAPFCARCGQSLAARGTRLLGRQDPAAPAAPALAPGRARLVLERGEGAEGAVFRLGPEPAAAGRAGAVAFPADPCLAEHHATFLFRGGSLVVRDEAAPGGVFLRLRPGASASLRGGDLFAVGGRLLRWAGTLPPPAPPPPAPPPPDGTRRLGSPRPPGAAVVVEEWLEGGAGGRVYVRPGPAVTIGRAGCAVDLGDDPWLSQAHAELFVERDGTARLRDLGSSTGTFVRLPPRAERELAEGDAVRLGREVLRVAAS